MLLRRVACALSPLLMLAPSAQAVARAAEPKDASPFEALRMVPDAVDAAAVFNDPARTLLLSDSGRTLRTALAAAGLFTHTEHAWSALAQALGTDTDQTITDLLGRRVIVVWDGLGHPPGAPRGLADAIDTRWVLVCEVDQAYLGRLRDRLKPVKRDIVQGRPLYAIEQGRYGIVLLDAPDPSRPARVLLAPRDGAPLLTRVLGSIISLGKDPAVDAPASIMDGRDALAEQLALPHAQDPWAVSWLVQTPSDAPGGGRRALAGVVCLDDARLQLRFATDIPAPQTLGDAPASLLDAADPDAPLALAAARLPAVLVDEHTLNISMGVGASAPSSESDAPPDLFSAPGLLVLTEPDAGDAGSAALTLFVRHARRDREPPAEAFAKQCDAFMRRLIGAYDPAQAPDYQGCFPAAVRTQRIDLAPDDTRTDHAWPGPRPSLSWASGALRHANAMTVSLGGEETDTAAHARRLLDAAQALDALSDQPSRSGVLLRARMRPARVMGLLGDSSLIDLALSRLVERVSCDIERSPRGGVRGALTLELRRDPARPDLGTDPD